MKNFQYLLIAFFGLSILSACIKDDFDAPDTACLDQGQSIDNIISIADLKAAFNNSSIDADVYVKAEVTASDESGNIYKEFFVQDATGALSVSVDITNSYTKYPVGRTVYIYVNGLYLMDSDIGYGLDGSFVSRIPAIYIDDIIVRGACTNEVEPLDITLSQLSSVEVGTLVRISDVEFEDGLDGVTYANAATQQSENRYIQDCSNNSVIVRNSGFADFAGELLPAGNGTITGVYAPFGSTPQLLIRDTDDCDMTATRCDGSNPNQNIVLSKNFEDGSIVSGGWDVVTPIGTFDWEIGTQGSGQQGANYAKMSNYAGSNSQSESWLISPSIDVSAETNPIFKFINAYNYSGDPLEVLISTDYDGGGDPSTASWTDLNPVLSTGGWDWVSSGNIDLSLYQTGPFHIAFKYTGSNSDGSTWEVDAIQIIAD